MAWSRFTYWKRGNTVKPPLKKAPKGSNKPFILHQIENGDFDPSPYWNMIEQEYKMLDKEVAEWKEENPDASEITYMDWYRTRKSVYNKRIIKLDKEHWDHHYTRMNMFKQGLRDHFLLDLWDEVLEKDPETPMEFYNLYAEIKKEKIAKAME